MMNQHSKVPYFIIVLALSSLVCSPPEGGTIQGSGTIVTRDESIDGFSKIDAGLGIKRLTVHKGDNFQVTLQIDQSFIPYLHVNEWDKTLTIHLEENRMTTYVGQFEVDVVVPFIDEIILRSDMEATLGDFESFDSFNVGLYSYSKLEGDLEVRDLQLQVFTHSRISMRGHAESINIRASNWGYVDLSEFQVQFAILEARSNSTILIDVLEQLDVVAMENSSVIYSGDPKNTTIESDESSLVVSKD
jgi:hypothetical protein